MLLSLVIMMGILVGCSQNEVNPNSDEMDQQQEQADETEEEVQFTISEANGETVIEQKDITIDDGAILMDVLKQHFEVEETDGFITSIEGHSIDEQEGIYWMYDVNGEMASVGATELELTDGDHIHFDLQSTD